MPADQVPFVHRRVPTWGETDGARIVYTVRFVDYAMDAIEAWFREVEIPHGNVVVASEPTLDAYGKAIGKVGWVRVYVPLFNSWGLVAPDTVTKIKPAAGRKKLRIRRRRKQC